MGGGKNNMIFERKNEDVERLKNVLISDKQFSPEKIQKVLKSDVYALLTNYCELMPDDIDVNVEVLDNGTFKFVIEASSNRLKIFGSLPDEF